MSRGLRPIVTSASGWIGPPFWVLVVASLSCVSIDAVAVEAAALETVCRVFVVERIEIPAEAIDRRRETIDEAIDIEEALHVVVDPRTPRQQPHPGAAASPPQPGELQDARDADRDRLVARGAERIGME